jgi:hypothetical protein
LFTVPVKTSLTLQCVAPSLRKNTRMMTTTDAPMTCHHTEMLLTSASRWLEKMLTSVVRMRMPRKMKKTRSSE